MFLYQHSIHFYSDGPSEGYWEILAERRRVALDAALKENEELHQRIALLEEENAQCKLLLDETRHLVETLTVILSTINFEIYVLVYNFVDKSFSLMKIY